MITLADVPSATTRPADAKRSAVRSQLVRDQFGRRNFLRAILVVTGSALVVGVEGGIRKIGAFADTAPTYSSCAAYVDAQISHYGQAYADGVGRWWAVCNPHASDVGGGEIGWDQIRGEFCNNDGYHRQDSEIDGTLLYNYNRRASSCAGKNAWTWKVDQATSWQNKHSRRCSDGQRLTFHDGDLISRNNTACRDFLPAFDPPASSLPFNQYTPDGCPPGASNPSEC